jgi:hypothetical protein
MILGHPLFRRNVAEHRRLLMVRPAHPNFLLKPPPPVNLQHNPVRNDPFSASC